MRELELVLGLFVAGMILAAAARRVGAPYPVFLAVGGALLAFLPGAPSFSVPLSLRWALRDDWFGSPFIQTCALLAEFIDVLVGELESPPRLLEQN